LIGRNRARFFRYRAAVHGDKSVIFAACTGA